MRDPILIAGGGIGGLAAALACGRAGWPVHVFERAQEFGEVGAGIQMGPNVTRLLREWNLAKAIAQVASFPQALQVFSALDGAELGALRLGASMRERYGAPYATIHRADLHKLLLIAAQQQGDVYLHVGSTLVSFEQDLQGVRIHTVDGLTVPGEALVGADGIRSVVRQQLLGDGEPRRTTHLAYRALVRQKDLPSQLRSQNVSVWLGPRLHLVQYPVRKGNWLNVVAIVQGQLPGEADQWDHPTGAPAVRQAMVGACSHLQDLVAAIEIWRAWPLCDRIPLRNAAQHAQGRVALLGDAAHPMRPYLAQGAGMAIEDAACLQRVLTAPDVPMPTRLQHFALERWRRNARVQARSIRNGEIFHSSGVMRWGRDLSMRLLGENLLDVPWLYRGA